MAPMDKTRGFRSSGKNSKPRGVNILKKVKPRKPNSSKQVNQENYKSNVNIEIDFKTVQQSDL